MTLNLIDEILLAHPVLRESVDWFPYLETRKNRGEFASLYNRLRPLLECAGTEISSGNSAKAANYIGLATVVDATKALKCLRNSGILRMSRYNFGNRGPVDVVERLLKKSSPLSMPSPFERYLTSMKLLLGSGKEVARLKKSLEGFLIRNQKTVLKSVIAFADSLFMVQHEGHSFKLTEELAGYSKEELAEAASYIIHIFDRCIGIHDKNFNYIGETRIERGLYAKLFIKAAKIRAYFEAEILIDDFNYECERSGQTLRIVPPSPELEKSIRIGYAMVEQSGNHSIIAKIRAMRDGEVSIISVADSLYEHSADEMVALKREPISRYVFRLPDVSQFRDLFSQNGFTIEERLYLYEVLSTELVSWEELKNFRFEGAVTFEGMLKVHRLFVFLARIASKHLQPKFETEAELVYRSLVPVFEKRKLKEILGWCVGKDEAEGILRLLSFATASSGIVDIQYRSILDGGNFYLVPLHIAGSTNWYRNVAHMQQQRVIANVEQDGASRELSACLRHSTSLIEIEYETKLGGQRFEIDVICKFGDYLFIFECKHSLLPCNVFELRTSYKHMLKGASQLSKIAGILSEAKYEKELYRRLGWKTNRAKEIVTCIVSSNRMFSGLRMDGHPVRSLKEIINMVQTGYIRFIQASVYEDEKGQDVKDNNVAEYYLWKNTNVTPEFLYEYIAKDLLQTPLFDSMIENNRVFKIYGTQLEFQSYALDLGILSEALNKKFPNKNPGNIPSLL